MIPRLPGFDSDTFIGHSTTSASCSKEKALCISTKGILKRYHWSSATTSEKFYHKNIIQVEDEFQSNIFERFSREDVPMFTFDFKRRIAWNQCQIGRDFIKLNLELQQGREALGKKIRSFLKKSKQRFSTPTQPTLRYYLYYFFNFCYRSWLLSWLKQRRK